MSLFQSKQNIFSTSSSHQMNTNPSLDSIKKAEEYTKSSKNFSNKKISN